MKTSTQLCSRMRMLILITCVLPLVFARAPLSLRLGSVFLAGDTRMHESFRQTVRALNDNPILLNTTRVDTDLQYAKTDRYDAYQRICTEVQYSVMAVFGSSDREVDTSVASVCSALHIPYLTTGTSFALDDNSGKYTVQMGPQATHLVQAVHSLVVTLGWKDIAFIVHRKTGSLDPGLLIEQLQVSGVNVHFLELVREDIRPDLVLLRQRGIERFVVDLTSNLLETFFDQAMKSGIVHTSSSFILADLDFMSVNLNSVTQTGANLLGFSLVDQNRLREAMASGKISNDLGGLLLETYKAALMYDAVHMFAHAVEFVGQAKDIDSPRVKCDDPDAPYELGPKFIEALESVSFDGLSSRPGTPITLKPSGPKQGLARTDISMDVVRLLESSGARITIGEWNWSKSSGSQILVNPQDLEKLQNRHPQVAMRHRNQKLKDLVIQAHEDSALPMLNVRRDLNGNVLGFEGLLIDLINQMAKDLSFNYTLRFSSDLGQKRNGNWTGLIKKLTDREADVGLAAIPQDRKYSKAIEFSPPIVTSHLTLMIQRPDRTHQSNEEPQISTRRRILVSFLDPFPFSLWLSIIVAFIVTSLLLFLVGRISPYERRATQDSSCFGDGLSLCSTFWFTLTGFFLRGTTIQPKSISARFLSAIWWIFCLCILILYITSFYSRFFGRQSGTPTTNMGGPSSGSNYPVLLDHMLRNNPDFKVGGTPEIRKLLEMSNDPLHQRLRQHLDPSLEFDSPLEASRAVVNTPNLGFIVESVQADTLMKDNCHLTTVGDLGPKFYGIAFPLESSLKRELSEQILKYAEDGTLFSLRSKWLVDMEHACGVKFGPGNFGQQYQTPTPHEAITKDSWDTDGDYLSCGQVEGPFLMLLVCGVLSVVIAIAELIIFSLISSKQRRLSSPPSSPVHNGSLSHHRHYSQSPASIMKEEIRSMFQCAKPVALSSSMNSSNNGHHGNYRINGSADVPSPNGSPYKNNSSSYFQQTQALLRKDNSSPEDANSQL